MRLLVQADVDGELTAAEAARAEGHLEYCPGCAHRQAQLRALGPRLRQEVSSFTPPDELLAAVRARLAAFARPVPPQRNSAVANDNRASLWNRVRSATTFGGGFASAAALALLFLLPHVNDLSDAVVADHIRALQPGHLIDVASTDRHTVKPWFDGRLDFAPPVNDFRSAGFPLQGGRLDYLDGKLAAALIYNHGQHVIDLFVWPESGGVGVGMTEGSLHGYNYVRWHQNGMAFWAVSDVEADSLSNFVQLVRQD
jgi:anti-sigma factor RsiW